MPSSRVAGERGVGGLADAIGSEEGVAGAAAWGSTVMFRQCTRSALVGRPARRIAMTHVFIDRDVALLVDSASPSRRRAATARRIAAEMHNGLPFIRQRLGDVPTAFGGRGMPISG